MEKKKFIRIVQTTNSCRFENFNQLTVYSAVFQQTRLEIEKGKTRRTSIRRLARQLGKGHRTVAKALQSLEQWELVAQRAIGQWVASHPKEKMAWFTQTKKERPEWWQNLCTWKIYLPQQGKMTLRQSAVLFVLDSCQGNGFTPGATLLAHWLYMCRPNIWRIRRQLKTKGLISNSAQVQIQPEHGDHWQDIPQAEKPREHKPSQGCSDFLKKVAYWVEDKLDKARCFETRQERLDSLLKHEAQMRAANYTTADINAYWSDAVKKKFDCAGDHVEVFIKKGFSLAFKIAEQDTAQNRLKETNPFKGPNSGGLLKTQTAIVAKQIWDFEDKQRRHKTAEGDYLSVAWWEPNACVA